MSNFLTTAQIRAKLHKIADDEQAKTVPAVPSLKGPAAPAGPPMPMGPAPDGAGATSPGADITAIKDLLHELTEDDEFDEAPKVRGKDKEREMLYHDPVPAKHTELTHNHITDDDVDNVFTKIKGHPIMDPTAVPLSKHREIDINDQLNHHRLMEMRDKQNAAKLEHSEQDLKMPGTVPLGAPRK